MDRIGTSTVQAIKLSFPYLRPVLFENRKFQSPVTTATRAGKKIHQAKLHQGMMPRSLTERRSSKVAIMGPIVDTFLFSEAHEAELLLAKLHVEEDLVTHWIAVENAYDTKGVWKGTCLGAVLEDDRFAPFLDRLTVLTLEERFHDRYKPSTRDRVEFMVRRAMGSSAALRGFEERPYFFAERKQREAANEATLDLSGGTGWVIISDVDEMVDGSSSYRRGLIERATSMANVLHLPRRRFVYDFDNVSVAPFRYVPMVRIESLGESPLGTFRLTPEGVPSCLEPLVFEYSYCYERRAIERKLVTFTHVDPGVQVVERALECNHAPVTESSMKNHHWYETIDTEEAEHPTYISEHMSELKTGVVNPEYRLARVRRYPSLFDSQLSLE